MADVTISSLPQGTPSGSAVIPYSQNNQTLKTNVSTLTANLAPSNSLGLAKAWVRFNGTGALNANQTILDSYNVSSVIRTGTGAYVVNFPSGVFSNTNYSFHGMSSTNLVRASFISGPLLDVPTTTSFKFANFSLIYTGQPASILEEAGQYICVAFFGS